MKNRTYFFILLFIEIITVTYLAIKIIKIINKKNINIVPIKKDSVLFNKYSNLKYFYEPIPNTIEQADKRLPWLPHHVRYTINSDTLK
jgi:hypothetical protein